MDVGIRAVLNGFEEAKKQVSDLNKELERTETTSKNIGTAGTTGGKGITDLSKAAGDAAQEMGNLDATTVRVAGVLGGVFVVAIGYAIKQLAEGFNHVRVLGDELDRLSQQTGISAEKLSSWQLVASTNNMTIAQLGNGIQMFNKHIIDATRETGLSAEAFESIGISIRDSSGALKDNEALLKEVADKFRTMEDGAGKSALAIHLFGGAGKTLIPILNQGAAGLEKLEEEAKKAGITMSNDTAKAAAELNANLEVLKSYGQGFWMSFASPVIQGLVEITRVMRESRAEGASFLSTLFSIQTLGSVRKDQKNTTDTINRLEAQLAAQPADSPLRKHTQQALDAQYSKLQSLYKTEGIMTGEGVEGPQSLTPAPELNVKTPKEKKVKDPMIDYIRSQDTGVRMAMDQMDLEIKAERSTAEEKIKLIDAILAADVGSNNMRMSLLKEREKTIEDASKKEIKSIEERQKAEEKLARFEAEDRKGAEKASRDFADKEIEEIKRTSFSHEEMQRRLQDLEDSFRDLGGAGQAAFERVREEIKKTSDEATRDAARMREIFGRSTFDIVGLFGNLHRSVSSVFADILKGNESLASGIKKIFKSAVDSVINEFGRLLANDVFKLIFGMGPGGIFTGNAGIGGSLLGGAASGVGSAAVGGGGGGGILTGAGSSIANLLGIGGAGVGGISSAGVMTAAPVFEAGEMVAAAEFSSLASTAGASAAASGLSMAVPIIGGAILAYSLLTDKKHPAYPVSIHLVGDIGPGGFSGEALGLASNGSQNFSDNLSPANYAAISQVVSGAYPFSSLAATGDTRSIDFTGPPTIGQADNNAFWSQLDAYVRGMASGGESIVSKPTLFLAGETGSERVSVSPMGAAHRGSGRGGVTIQVNGISLMDNYSARRLAYELKRVKV